MSDVQRIDQAGPEFAALKACHTAFWRREEGGFLHADNVFAPSIPSRLPQRDGTALTKTGRLTPDMIVVEALIEQSLSWNPGASDALYSAKSQVLAYPGVDDLMPFCRPFFKVPWLEAMLGCPITMTEGQIWVETYDGDVDDLSRKGVDLDGNPWLELYVEFLTKMQARLEPTYPASTNTLLRGPSDLVAALLGVREACVGWIQEPELMDRLMRICTDVHLALVRAGYETIRPFAGGYMSGYGIWAPDPVSRMQADHSTLLSPTMYQRQIMPYDVEIIQALPLCHFHIHNNGYHIAHLLVQVDELDAIEVVVDPYPTGARREHEIERMQMIQEHKSLMIDANMPSKREAEDVLAQLTPRGLYYNAQYTPELLADPEAGVESGEVWLIK